MRRVRFTLAVGLLLLAIALVVVIAHPMRVIARTNTPATETFSTATTGKLNLCQGDEAVPAGTSALHVLVWSQTLGPKLSITLSEGGRVISSGSKQAGWRGVGVTVPIHRLPRALTHASICLKTGPLVELLQIAGQPTPAMDGALSAGKRLPGRLQIAYLRAGTSSWWAQKLEVARRIGLGRSPSGGWIAVLLVLMMATAAGLAVWTLARPAFVDRPHNLWRSLPAPAATCMLVAFLSAASWSIVSPLFQIDDEPAHFAYVQQLAQRGQLPALKPGRAVYSPEEELALVDLRFETLIYDTENHSLDTLAGQRHLEADLGSNPSRVGSGSAGFASTEPPLYYLLQTIPYELGSGGTILLRMTLMRLLSALMAALTALFVYLFLREALPGTPWAWTVGALGAALAPLVGTMSGSINPDSMLCAVAAGCFFCLARGFRRGLSLRVALAIGAITAVGFLTKLSFLGLAPGVLFGLVVLAVRASARHGHVAYRWLALALALALSPIAASTLIDIADHGVAHLGGTVYNPFAHHPPSTAISYIWQSYLPTLPSMSHVFAGIPLWRVVWFNDLLGLYGWDDIYFSDQVEQLALIPALVGFVLCARTLIAGRPALRRRLGELTTYALMMLGILALIGLASFDAHPAAALEYRLTRYLLPLLTPGCAAIALAARGAGRRWAPAVGALIVVLILAHDIFSQLLVISRYYS